MSFKIFLIWSSGDPPVQLCNFERGHQGIHMQLYKLGPVVQEEMSSKEKVYGRTTDKDCSQ